MRLLAAPDKFRGSASAPAVADAAAGAAESLGHECTRRPLADGGEGTLDALGGADRDSLVTGPLGRPVRARWRLADGTAVIEMAQASGLALIGGAAGNDPLGATTRGTGELIAEALRSGARRIVVAVGGSATTDGGVGAVEVLSASLPAGRFPTGVEVLVACDVTTRFTDAARVFSPQKGADPEQVAALTERLERLRRRYLEEYGVDVDELAGSGAAGGLAGGLAAIGARLRPGFDVVAAAVGLEALVRGCDLVVTGEGKLDEQSFRGKVVGAVSAMARRHGVPVLAVVGAADPEVAARPGLDVVPLLDRYGADAAWNRTTDCVADAVRSYLTGDFNRPG